MINGKQISPICKTLTASYNQDILREIEKITPKLDSNRSIIERIFWIFNDIHDFPQCITPNCINDHILLSDIKYFKGFQKGYQLHCCNKCA